MNNSSSQHEGNEQAAGSLVAWSLAYGLLDVVVILGNVITLLVFFRNKKLLRTRANYFLINLAIADMMVGTFAIPMYVYHLISALYNGEGVWKQFSSKIYTAVDVFVGCASIYTLTFIALERAFSVCLPQIHRHARLKTYYGLLGLIWLLSILVSCLRFLYETDLLKLKFFFYVMLVLFSIALLIICISYAVIWFKMKFRFANREGNKRKREQDKRLAILLFIVTVVFGLTWMPFQIINIVAFFCYPCRKMSIDGVNFAKFLHYGNSCVNPIIYSFLVPEFRKTVASIFRKLRNNDETGISTFEMHSAKT